jgi:hypothetical protein
MKMFGLPKEDRRWAIALVVTIVLGGIGSLIMASIRDNTHLNSPEQVNRFFDGYAKSHPYESSVVTGNLEVVKRSYILFPIPLPKRIVERYSFDQVKDDPNLDNDVLIIVNNGDRTRPLNVGKAHIFVPNFVPDKDVQIISGGIISPPPDDRTDHM